MYHLLTLPIVLLPEPLVPTATGIGRNSSARELAGVTWTAHTPALHCTALGCKPSTVVPQAARVFALEGATEPGTCTTTPCRGLEKHEKAGGEGILCLTFSSEVNAGARQCDPHPRRPFVWPNVSLPHRTASWNSEPHRLLGNCFPHLALPDPEPVE